MNNEWSMFGASALMALAIALTGCEKEKTTQPEYNVIPRAPSNLQIEVMTTPPQIKLLWQDSSLIETGVEIERKVKNGDFILIVIRPAEEDYGTRTYLDSNVQIGEIYTYRVRSINRNAKSEYSNESDESGWLYPNKEGRRFAGQHFNETVYREREFFLASTNQHDSGAYTGTKEEWEMLNWEMKIHYLPERGFGHELPVDHDSTSNDSLTIIYYEYIGKYVHQFGFGWDDVCEMFNGQVVGYGIGDDPTTSEYDDRFGAAQRAKYYHDTFLLP